MKILRKLHHFWFKDPNLMALLISKKILEIRHTKNIDLHIFPLSNNTKIGSGLVYSV
jgi:hypothetical protein